MLLDEDVLFVDDGDVLTSTGLGAGVDLCLHVLRADHGSEVVNRAARYCVVPPWREGGQSQFIDRHVPDGGTDTTAPTRAWALGHLDASLDLASLAEHARTSVRTFSRRFRAETGQSPGSWLLQQRVRHAMHLLESTDLRWTRSPRRPGSARGRRCANTCGPRTGVSPLAHRKTFRAS